MRGGPVRVSAAFTSMLMRTPPIARLSVITQGDGAAADTGAPARDQAIARRSAQRCRRALAAAATTRMPRRRTAGSLRDANFRDAGPGRPGDEREAHPTRELQRCLAR